MLVFGDRAHPVSVYRSMSNECPTVGCGGWMSSCSSSSRMTDRLLVELELIVGILVQSLGDNGAQPSGIMPVQPCRNRAKLDADFVVITLEWHVIADGTVRLIHLAHTAPERDLMPLLADVVAVRLSLGDLLLLLAQRFQRIVCAAPSPARYNDPACPPCAARSHRAASRCDPPFCSARSTG